MNTCPTDLISPRSASYWRTMEAAKGRAAQLRAEAIAAFWRGAAAALRRIFATAARG
jgi:hypothetical protein